MSGELGDLVAESVELGRRSGDRLNHRREADIERSFHRRASFCCADSTPRFPSPSGASRTRDRAAIRVFGEEAPTRSRQRHHGALACCSAIAECAGPSPTVEPVEHIFASRRRGAHRRSAPAAATAQDRKSTRLNSSHGYISYAVFCLKKKNNAPSGSAA